MLQPPQVRRGGEVGRLMRSGGLSLTACQAVRSKRCGVECVGLVDHWEISEGVVGKEDCVDSSSDLAASTRMAANEIRSEGG